MPSKRGSPAIDYRTARAYGHPIRARALVLLAQRVASPKEIAAELGEPLGKVSYHVRELRDDGLIELVETDGSRGGVQHFYRASRLPILDLAGMVAQSGAERRASAETVLNLMVADIAMAMREDTMNSRPERILARFHARLDERGWKELTRLYDEALLRSIAIHNEAVARLTESGEAGFSAAAFGLVFEMADPESAAREPR